jgi:hypothetical protein
MVAEQKSKVTIELIKENKIKALGFNGNRVDFSNEKEVEAALGGLKF